MHPGHTREQGPYYVEVRIVSEMLDGAPNKVLLIIRHVTKKVRTLKENQRKDFQQQLTNTLSHEQLTPLNSIISLSKLRGLAFGHFRREFTANKLILSQERVTPQRKPSKRLLMGS